MRTPEEVGLACAYAWTTPKEGPPSTPEQRCAAVIRARDAELVEEIAKWVHGTGDAEWAALLITGQQISPAQRHALAQAIRERFGGDGGG